MQSLAVFGRVDSRYTSERNGSGNLFSRYVMSWGLFLTRNGTWNMFCWIHLLLVKGSLCSKQKGTDRKISSADMLCVEASFLHGTEREMYSTEHMFCWIHWGNIGEICSIDTRAKYLFITRNGTRNLFDMLLERNGSGNLFFRIFFLVHRSAPLRVTIEMGIALEHMNIADMLNWLL